MTRDTQCAAEAVRVAPPVRAAASSVSTDRNGYSYFDIPNEDVIYREKRAGLAMHGVQGGCPRREVCKLNGW